MAITLTTNWGHTEGNNVTSVATPTAAPVNSTDWITGWLIGPPTLAGLTNITDSVNGAIPSSQIIQFGTTGGVYNGGIYFYYEKAVSTASRTITANFTGGVHCSITAQSWSGLASSLPVDQIGPFNNNGTGTVVTTGSTGTTTFTSGGLVLAYFTQDSGTGTNTWSAPSITIGSNTGFLGLGNATSEGNAPAFDAGYLLPTANGTASAQITSTQSAAFLGAIITLSDTSSSPTLTAGTGIFTLTGENATLSTSSGSITLTASTGTFTLTGENATLTESGVFNLLASTGAFDLIGEIAESDYEIEPAVGLFALAGGVVTLNFNGTSSFGITGFTGLFSLTGFTTTLSESVQFSLFLAGGSFALVGESNTGNLSCNCVGEVGSLTTIILNLEIVTDAFQKIGIIDETEAPSAEQGANGLRILNDMMANQQRDGLRVGWYRQTQLEAVAPLRQEDVWGVKILLARQLASHYGIQITNQLLLDDIANAERMLTKRSLRYFESDLGELSRPQGGPWGGPFWL